MSTKPKPRAKDDVNRTLDKYLKDEVQLQKRLGPARTQQMRRLVDQCAEELAVVIAHERANRRPDKDAEIWGVIGGEPDFGIALTLLVAGLHAGIRGYHAPKRKPKYKPTSYKWFAHVGEELGFERGEPALYAGMWASKLVVKLPMFDLTDDGMMVVRLDAPEVRAIINGRAAEIVEFGDERSAGSEADMQNARTIAKRLAGDGAEKLIEKVLSKNIAMLRSEKNALRYLAYDLINKKQIDFENVDAAIDRAFVRQANAKVAPNKAGGRTFDLSKAEDIAAFAARFPSITRTGDGYFIRPSTERVTRR